MFSTIRNLRTLVSRREIIVLSFLGVMMLGLPTFQSMAEPVKKRIKHDVKKSHVGRIYVYIGFHAEDPSKPETEYRGLVAIDPVTGKFEKIRTDDAQSFRISPDGETIAYEKSGAIWTDNLKGTSPGKVIDVRGRPVWSPDSKHIIVSHGVIEKEETEKKKPKKPVWKVTTWKTDLFGNNRIRINIPETDHVKDWSLDGKWIVTTTDRHPPYGSGYQLYVMKPDGTGERRLTQGRGLNVYAQFSPDSQKIVYLHQRGRNNIHVIDIDGQNDRTVFEDDNFTGAEAAVWSPDSKQLAVVVFDWTIHEKGNRSFSVSEDTNFRIIIMDADGSNQRTLKLSSKVRPFWIGHPHWR